VCVYCGHMCTPRPRSDANKHMLDVMQATKYAWPGRNIAAAVFRDSWNSRSPDEWKRWQHGTDGLLKSCRLTEVLCCLLPESSEDRQVAELAQRTHRLTCTSAQKRHAAQCVRLHRNTLYIGALSVGAVSQAVALKM
jgi:hypothetical protein